MHVLHTLAYHFTIENPTVHSAHLADEGTMCLRVKLILFYESYSVIFHTAVYFHLNLDDECHPILDVINNCYVTFI